MRPLARCVRHRLVVPGIWLMVLARGADGANWWALAIGHARRDRQARRHLTRGMPGSRRARRTTLRPATAGGLWVAAVTGRYMTVCCQLTSPEPAHLTAAAQLSCRLAPSPRGTHDGDLRSAA